MSGDHIPTIDQIDFEDPGVSNGDVDWLFRGKAVKKLSRKTNTVNIEVQSQLQLAQQQQRNISISSSNLTNSQSEHSVSSSVPAAGVAIPLKPSLKPAVATPTPNLKSKSSTKPVSNPAPNSVANPTIAPLVPKAVPAQTSVPASTGTTRSRASSFTKRVRSLSDSKDKATAPVIPNPTSVSPSSATPPPARKGLFSSLSSKIKSRSVQQTSAPIPTTGYKESSYVTPIKPSPQPVQQQSVSRSSSLKDKTLTKVLSGNKSKPVAATQSTSPASTSSASDPPNSVLVHHSSPKQQQQHHHHGLHLHLHPSHSSSHSSHSLDPETRLKTIPFKRVVFALDALPEDPQQQIPSRKPKRGNVLIPEDMTAPPARLTIGISPPSPPADSTSGTTGTNTATPASSANKVDDKKLREAIDRQKQAQIESRKHANEAHAAAVRIAKEVSSYKKLAKLGKDKEDEEEEEEDMSWIGQNHSTFGDFKAGDDIDTPLHEHVDYFDDSSNNNTPKEESSSSKGPTDLPLDLLYTRCCHLREILPIPATIKQLRGKTKPLNVLKMLNPKPTLIDILSFSDFLAIAPINTVIFDNVTMDSYMLNIVLVSLSNSKTLEKLSLRNVPIDNKGWESLCRFLTLNHTLNKLDISQQKTKADLPLSFFRSEMDWDLFTHSLKLRNGLQELVINGCKLTTLQFKNLVDYGLSLATMRLGVAATNLDFDKSGILSRWLSEPGNTCIGVDIGFNDLSSGNQLIPFNSVFHRCSENIKLVFFSLNSTCVSVEDCKKTIESLSYVKTLRFLDLGNDPQLFPGILPVLEQWLPRYPELRRLHFEFDELSEVELMRLSLLYQKCPKLVHVSLLGNSNISSRVSATLYSAIKHSGIYNLDVDYDLINEELSSKMAFYLMRNLERFLNKSYASTGDEEELIFDGSLITKAAESLLESAESENGSSENDDENTQIFTKSLVERTIRLRNDIHTTMNNLFKLREDGKLSLEGKETLLRFCLLDDSLESILHIFLEDRTASPQQPETAASGAPTERPQLMRNLSSQLPMHKESSDLIFTGPIVSPTQSHNSSSYFETHSHASSPSFKPTDHPLMPPDQFLMAPDVEIAPHNVVSDDNSNTIDHLTGKPVFMRRSSTNSLHARKIEEEEGEFHRWGFFVQQQNHILPVDESNANKSITPTNPNPATTTATTRSPLLAPKPAPPPTQQLTAPQQQHTSSGLHVISIPNSSPPSIIIEKPKFELKIKAIPSGPQLREAVIKAKGIESVSDLIHKMNKDMTKMNSIYGADDSTSGDTTSSSTIKQQATPTGIIGTATATAAAKSTLSSVMGTSMNNSNSLSSSNLGFNHPPPSTATTSISTATTTNTTTSTPRKSSTLSTSTATTTDPTLSIVAPTPTHNTTKKRRSSSVNERPSSPISLNSMEDHDYFGDALEEPTTEELKLSKNKTADEVYEKILDDVVRVRSNRSIGSNK